MQQSIQYISNITKRHSLISSDMDYNHLPCNLLVNKSFSSEMNELLSNRTLTSLLNIVNIKNCLLNISKLYDDDDDEFLLNDINYSKSLIIFIILISIVSCISIIGNLILAKILYSKRHRLSQTDRIVLCLAISELCLVLIDSPIEIYRFLSYTYGQSWLCCFHTFLESLLSSCIIFYHLLGAIDRFIFVYVQTTTTRSTWTKCKQWLSTKKCSLVLLIIPIIVSLPVAITNTLHSYVLRTSKHMMTCVVQYTQYKIIIIILVSFYILPIILSLFLHVKLIHYIRSRHEQQYITTYLLPPTNSIRQNYLAINSKTNYHRIAANSATFINPNSKRRRRMCNITTVETHQTNINTAIITSPTSPTTQSSASSGSSSTTNASSTIYPPCPIVIYKMNAQACANARKTVLLLVSLLTFYVFCWAPYNIYTWIHAYQVIETEKKTSYSINNLTNSSDVFVFNNPSSIIDSPKSTSFHSDLKRIILINYSLYFLSVVSMCFSFIFYFTLNKQARLEFKRLFSFIIHCGRRRTKQQKHASTGKYNYASNRRNYNHNNLSKKKIGYSY
ncbi:unnamed protein product [Didymodactylos carnosus]|uniref:G-protein coupled receptors family 1 profile domain-containing protein n=1 Tax=Didymodactylos carnosus TaxID=1234261 RepID=A0A814J9C2_9BILA|nr:unnamed protein product [Didymodactylos carnosus]CAF1036262.1 unnamed protein product [Didymodactylos carnosus]CAF3522715.1 unnamed protein product [Didymodactylos carnosus]CAF3806843.1 unnamed protein product [Didymodactylos carnosus]